MTTMDTTLTQFVLGKLAMRARTRKQDKASTRTLTWVQTLVRLMFHLGGFGCLTFAGFTWTITAGYVVAGLSCFAMSRLLTGGAGPDTDNTNNRPHQTQR